MIQTNKDPQDNLSRLVNYQLTETVEIAKQITTSLENQNHQIQEVTDAQKQLENQQITARHKVRLMESAFYRWWIWAKEITTDLFSGISNKTNVDPDDPNRNKIVAPNNQHFHVALTNKSVEQETPDNLATLRQISLTIGETLDSQNLKLNQISEKNSDLVIDFSKTNKKLKRLNS